MNHLGDCLEGPELKLVFSNAIAAISQQGDEVASVLTIASVKLPSQYIRMTRMKKG